MYKGASVLDIHDRVSAPFNGSTVLATMMASKSSTLAEPRVDEIPL